MKTDKISKILKEMRISKGYSLESIAQEIPVSKQGYHFWEQGLRAWKLDILAKLTTILDFELVIKEGEISISNHNTLNKKREVDDNMNSLQVSNTNFEGYEVIQMYTGTSNINFEEQNVLDTCLVYTDKKEACHTFNTIDTDNLVPVYALYNTEEQYVYPTTYDLDKRKAYNVYYWNYAPILEDNYDEDAENTVYINADKKIKVSKGYVSLDTKKPNEDGSYNVVAMFSKEEESTLGVFLVTDLKGFVIPQLEYITTDFPKILY